MEQRRNGRHFAASFDVRVATQHLFNERGTRSRHAKDEDGGGTLVTPAAALGKEGRIGGLGDGSLPRAEVGTVIGQLIAAMSIAFAVMAKGTGQIAAHIQ